MQKREKEEGRREKWRERDKEEGRERMLVIDLRARSSGRELKR